MLTARPVRTFILWAQRLIARKTCNTRQSTDKRAWNFSHVRKKNPASLAMHSQTYPGGWHADHRRRHIYSGHGAASCVTQTIQIRTQNFIYREKPSSLRGRRIFSTPENAYLPAGAGREAKALRVPPKQTKRLQVTTQRALSVNPTNERRWREAVVRQKMATAAEGVKQGPDHPAAIQRGKGLGI